MREKSSPNRKVFLSIVVAIVGCLAVSIIFKHRSSRRSWKPNARWKHIWSDTLEYPVKVLVTSHVMKWMDKVGGFDNYILNTPEQKLKSVKALQLREYLKLHRDQREARGEPKTWIELLPEFTAEDVMRETAELEAQLSVGTGAAESADDIEDAVAAASKELEEALEVDLSEEDAGSQDPAAGRG